MEREQMIELMSEFVTELKNKHTEMTRQLKKEYDYIYDLKMSKVMHEIAAMENAIKELKR